MKHLLEGFDQLSAAKQKHLLAELSLYTEALLKEQRASLSASQRVLPLSPVHEFDEAGSAADAARGMALIAEGKVGCLILAGGSGTRLQASGPKGATPVTLIRQKSLFQLAVEKARAASARAGRLLHLAIMTSPLNHAETLAFFEKHNWFGYPREGIDFFSQGMLPLLDAHQNWFLAAPGEIAKGPDGNGTALHHFCASRLYDKWRALGIEQLSVVLIDNALADPFDAELIGVHARHQAEITLKAVRRENPNESVGVIGLCQDKLCVREYSEVDADVRHAKKSDGQLLFPFANISLFCFSMDFVARAKETRLPWHSAHKQMYGHNVIKMEAFLFDLLDHAKRTALLISPREQCFAPLKNKSGEASLETVQQALQRADRETLLRITGHAPPDRSFELDPAFYYPTPELLSKWRNHPLPATDYISP